MPNTIESVKKLILTAVQNATGWTTIFGPADGPEPANQYCLVTLKSEDTQQHDIIKYTQTQTGVTEHQRSETELTFEVQARGKDAMTAGNKVVSYFDSTLRDIDLWPYVGSGGHDEVQDISTYHLGKILPVAVLNLHIHTTLPKNNTIEYMTNTDVTVKVKVENDTTTVGPVTIPDGAQ